MKTYRVVVTDNDPICPGECVIDGITDYDRAKGLAIENLEVDPVNISVEVWECDEFGNEDCVADVESIAMCL